MGISCSKIVSKIAPTIAAAYPIFTKRSVGRTVKSTLSTSSSSSSWAIGDEIWGRTILVSSGSEAGVPQLLQNRLSASRNDPQFLQRIRLQSTAKRQLIIHKFSLAQKCERRLRACGVASSNKVVVLFVTDS